MLGDDLEVCSLQGGDDPIIFFGTSGELDSWANNIPDYTLLDSAGRWQGMADVVVWVRRRPFCCWGSYVRLQWWPGTNILMFGCFVFRGVYPDCRMFITASMVESLWVVVQNSSLTIHREVVLKDGADILRRWSLPQYITVKSAPSALFCNCYGNRKLLALLRNCRS